MAVREKYRGIAPLPADWRERLTELPSVCAEHGVDLLYLFGSAARMLEGEGIPEDLDLAYVTAPRSDFFGFAQALSRVLRSDRVDLVDLGAASPVFAFEVVRTGRLLYRRSVERENAFELALTGRYRDEVVRLRRWAASRTGGERPGPA
ncbi:MAG TPA: nucleotidyltransferase domain-containing protein [Actinomycetota bacterium]|nr:nucleotidyltransferase domain-containing protein [Actinomycetota bacterium]